MTDTRTARSGGALALLGIGTAVAALAAYINFALLAEYGDSIRAGGSKAWNGLTFGGDPLVTLALLAVVGGLGASAVQLTGRRPWAVVAAVVLVVGFLVALAAGGLAGR